MIINITIAGKACAIEVNKDCFVPVIYSLNTKEGSVNYGKPTATQLGYFAGVNSFGYAVNKLIHEVNTSDEDKVTLQEFASRVEAATASVLEQLKDWDKLRKEV